MAVSDDPKEQYLELITGSGNVDPEQLIKMQIQNVARKLSKLLGLLEGGKRSFEEGSPEYRFVNSEEMKVNISFGSIDGAQPLAANPLKEARWERQQLTQRSLLSTERQLLPAAVCSCGHQHRAR